MSDQASTPEAPNDTEIILGALAPVVLQLMEKGMPVDYINYILMCFTTHQLQSRMGTQKVRDFQDDCLRKLPNHEENSFDLKPGVVPPEPPPVPYLHLADRYAEWAADHKPENYGRYDAFVAGYKLSQEEIEQLDVTHFPSKETEVN